MRGRPLWPPAVPRLVARPSQSNPRGSGPEVLMRERGHVTAANGVAEVAVFGALQHNVAAFSLSEVGQIWGFQAISGEHTGRWAWNLACGCILTISRTDYIFVAGCWFPFFFNVHSMALCLSNQSLVAKGCCSYLIPRSPCYTITLTFQFKKLIMTLPYP